jgi:predicted RNase H-like nuclease (RuvC/YqgF family)
MDSLTDFFDAFEESSKALLELMMGSEETDRFHQELLSYSELLVRNKELEAKVATLERDVPALQDKYENLRKEFQKVAAERDSQHAQVVELSHIQHEYGELKTAYQSTKSSLATAQKRLEGLKSSISSLMALEKIYQSFKAELAREGVDTRRHITYLDIQFRIEGQPGVMARTFRRTSSDKWDRISKDSGQRPANPEGYTHHF